MVRGGCECRAGNVESTLGRTDFGKRGRCGRGRHPRLGHNRPLKRQRRATYQPLQRQRRVTYQPWLKAKETGSPKRDTGLKARNIASRGRSIPNMFRAFSPLACFETHPLALQARLAWYAPLALWRTPAVGRWRGYLTTARRWRPWERRAPARHSFAVCPVGAPETPCRRRWCFGGRLPLAVGGVI